MARLEFQELEFEKKKQELVVKLYDIFSLSIPSADIERIAPFKTSSYAIEFQGIKKQEAERKFLFMLNSRMPHLQNKITKNSATFIHSESGIPLVGSISFGIVDRGSSLLEIKPATSCNLNCVYCSLSEGLKSRLHDFVVQYNYLADQTRRVVEYKGIDDVELHINCQGEPLLYAKLDQLIEELAKIPKVEVISINTNGIMLNKERIDRLIEAGLTRFNISFNAVNGKIASKMAGTAYPVNQVISMMEYIVSKGAPLVIAPVVVPGLNENEMPALIRLGKRLKAVVGIQNFLEYKHGRKPAKQWPWPEFYSRIKAWEQQFGMKLKLWPEDFNIRPAKSLPKPFKMGEIVKARVLCPGRFKNEAIVEARDRCITVLTNRTSGDVKFKIIRTKHNIYLGKAV